MLLGFVLLASLSVLAAVAAVALAIRGWSESRAELALTASTLWAALICGPVLALGWGGGLTPEALALVSAGASLVTLGSALAAGGRPFGATWRSIGIAFARLAWLPIAGILEAWRERSLVLVGLVAAAFVIAWTAWLSYLAPSSGWDGIWYHDTIVGFALQHRGFAWVDVPPNLEFVNGYPKTSECLSLWFVVFTDRRLIEVVPSLTAPTLMFGFYVLARRYTSWRVGAMGFASVLLLLPALALELRSTYVDVIFCALFIAATHFVTRPELRLRDVAMAALALGLLGGAKGTGLVLVPMLWAILSIRLLVMAGRRRSVVPIVFGALSVLLTTSMAAPFYVRNWVRHENPAWPLHLQKESLGIDWPGHWDVARGRDTETVLSEVFALPVPDGEFHDTRRNGYGNGPPFLLLPLAVFAFFAAPLLWLRTSLGRGPPRRALPHRRLGNLLVVAYPPLLVTLLLSPALWWARFNVHGIVAVFLLGIWAVGGPRFRNLGQGVLGALVLASMMTLWWSEPGWHVDREQAFELAAMSAEERSAFRVWRILGEPETMRARDRELGPGDVVAFTDDFGFPAVLWNERFSNQVMFVPFAGGPSDYLQGLEDASAEWAVARVRSPHERALLSRAELWERVGMTSDVNVAYRRTSMPF